VLTDDKRARHLRPRTYPAAIIDAFKSKPGSRRAARVSTISSAEATSQSTHTHAVVSRPSGATRAVFASDTAPARWWRWCRLRFRSIPDSPQWCWSGRDLPELLVDRQLDRVDRWGVARPTTRPGNARLVWSSVGRPNVRRRSPSLPTHSL